MATNFDIKNVSFNAQEIKALKQIFRKDYEHCSDLSDMIRNFTIDLIKDKIQEYKIYNVFKRHRLMGKNFSQAMKLLAERNYRVNEYFPELERMEAKIKQAEEQKQLLEDAKNKVSKNNNKTKPNINK